MNDPGLARKRRLFVLQCKRTGVPRDEVASTAAEHGGPFEGHLLEATTAHVYGDNDAGTDADDAGSPLPECQLGVPEADAVGYFQISVDSLLAGPVPGGGYWVPVDDADLVEADYPPDGHVIQYPFDDKPPERVGTRALPDDITTWDCREEDT